MFDLDAAVHDRIEPGCARQPVSLDVGNAELLPQATGADGHGFLCDRQHVFRTPKDVHQVDSVRNVGEAGITALTEHRIEARVDRNDAIAMLLQIAGDLMARAVFLGRQAHYRDRAAFGQDSAQVGALVGHGNIFTPQSW